MKTFIIISTTIAIAFSTLTSCKKTETATEPGTNISLPIGPPQRDLKTFDTEDRPKIVRGHIKDSATHMPVLGATVSIFLLSDNSMVAEITSVEDGLFEIPDISGGNYYLTATASGYHTTYKNIGIPFNLDSVYEAGVVPLKEY